jgi:hypothetical protein
MKLPEAIKLMESITFGPFDMTVDEFDSWSQEYSERLGTLVEQFCNDWKRIVTEAKQETEG